MLAFYDDCDAAVEADGGFAVHYVAMLLLMLRRLLFMLMLQSMLSLLS